MDSYAAVNVFASDRLEEALTKIPEPSLIGVVRSSPPEEKSGRKTLHFILLSIAPKPSNPSSDAGCAAGTQQIGSSMPPPRLWKGPWLQAGGKSDDLGWRCYTDGQELRVPVNVIILPVEEMRDFRLKPLSIAKLLHITQQHASMAIDGVERSPYDEKLSEFELSSRKLFESRRKEKVAVRKWQELILRVAALAALLGAAFHSLLTALTLTAWRCPSLFAQRLQERLGVLRQWPFILRQLIGLEDSRSRLPLTVRWELAKGYRLILVSSATLFFVDLLLGWLAAYALFSYTESVNAALRAAFRCLQIDVLRSQLQWLKDAPPALNVNGPLKNFCSEIIFVVIDTSAELGVYLMAFQAIILKVVASSAFFGLSFLISLTLDVLCVMTLHTFYIYVFVSQITCLMRGAIISLFNHFQGKTFNTWRKRVESCHYDSEQLLIGSIFFTSLFLLMPTIFIYYVLFVSIHLSILGAQLLLLFIAACLSHSPLSLLFQSPLDFQGPSTLVCRENCSSKACVWDWKCTPLSVGEAFCEPIAMGLSYAFGDLRPGRIIRSFFTGVTVHLHGSLHQLPRIIRSQSLRSIPKEAADISLPKLHPPFLLACFPSLSLRETYELCKSCFQSPQFIIQHYLTSPHRRGAQSPEEESAPPLHNGFVAA